MRRLTAADVEQMRTLRAQGFTLASIGSRFGVTHGAVRYQLSRLPGYSADRPRPAMNARERRLYRALRFAGISLDAIADWFRRDPTTMCRLTRDLGPHANAPRMRIPDAVRASVVASLLSGESLSAVAASHGIHARSVARISDAAKVARDWPTLGTSNPKLTLKTRRAILADITSGHTRTAAAARHGVSRWTVQMLARDAGLTRPRNPATKSAH